MTSIQQSRSTCYSYVLIIFEPQHSLFFYYTFLCMEKCERFWICKHCTSRAVRRFSWAFKIYQDVCLWLYIQLQLMLFLSHEWCLFHTHCGLLIICCQIGIPIRRMIVKFNGLPIVLHSILLLALVHITSKLGLFKYSFSPASRGVLFKVFVSEPHRQSFYVSGNWIYARCMK